MRIIGYIEHPNMKISIFKMDLRLSVKFESGLLEQTYKFRQQDGLDNLRDVQQLVDTEFIEGVAERFRKMEEIKREATERRLSGKVNDEFDEII